MNLEFHPVTKERWSDFEKLFESKIAPHNCWCTAWRKVEKKETKPTKKEKKASIELNICKNVPIGIIAYSNNEPMAWCSVAPRETYRKLGGDETINNVWSLVCFFVKRSFRGNGITKLLLAEAINYAINNGAKYIEAYPVESDSPSYRFMGFLQTFENADFKFIKKAGTRRNVILLALYNT